MIDFVPKSYWNIEARKNATGEWMERGYADNRHVAHWCISPGLVWYAVIGLRKGNESISIQGMNQNPSPTDKQYVCRVLSCDLSDAGSIPLRTFSDGMRDLGRILGYCRIGRIIGAGYYDGTRVQIGEASNGRMWLRADRSPYVVAALALE